ncbi:GNAT family N-acetyltransferase [Georgenia sp. Z1491]|uniref:GNAT family N-acetyltransferase n=1 Tax=Georgenia sp. Z1491 TaxID=3416707 RepID=UPI003CF65280
MPRTRIVTGRDDLEACWRIRWEVFVEEQHVPGDEEIDALDTDPTTTHVLATVDRAGGEDPVATARLLPAGPGLVRIGRVAVLRGARGTGAGRAVMQALHDVAVGEHLGPDGSVRVDIEAQEHAIAFYDRLGYELVSQHRYLDAGIWHKDMALTLRH